MAKNKTKVLAFRHPVKTDYGGKPMYLRTIPTLHNYGTRWTVVKQDAMLFDPDCDLRDVKKHFEHKVNSKLINEIFYV